ncbi:MAG TPA: hypothetical protein VIA62_09700 [Thermoanaerobaculia bacterium]|jgi:hypothetical protein|nr:hypothetical protein [Thermoanaerobaculia bacterium]
MANSRNIAVGILIGLALLAVAKNSAASVQIEITSPVEGADVGREETVSGSASDSNLSVYVLIRPVRSSTWWVERPPAPTNRNGSWKTDCYFGTPSKGVGEAFEVIAIVTEQKLKEGDQIDELPTYIARSETVTVHRTR